MNAICKFKIRKIAMKYKALFVIVGLFFSLPAEQAQISLTRTDFLNIQKAQAQVDSLLKWHLFYQIATTSCIVAGIGGAGYTVYRAAQKPEVPVVVKPIIPVDKDTFNLFSEKFHLFAKKFDEYMESYIAERNIQRNWILSQLHWLKQTATNQALTIIGSVGAAMVFNVFNNSLGPISKYVARLDGLLDRTVSGIYHRNNLEWFITNHANLVIVFNTLEQKAAFIEGRQVTSQSSLVQETPEQFIVVAPHESQRSAALKDFEAYWIIFVQQLESVLGFMQYTSLRNSNPLMRERMVALSNTLQIVVNDCAQAFEEKVLNSNNTTIALFDDLKALRARIGLEISNFTLLESFKRFEVMGASN